MAATFVTVFATLVFAESNAPAAEATVSTTNLMTNLDASNPASYTGSGTTWTDLSGNARNATLVGSGVTFDPTNKMLKFVNSGNGVNYGTLTGDYNDFSGGVTIDFEGNFGANADSWERIIDLSNAFDPNTGDSIHVGRRNATNDIFIGMVRGGVSYGHCYATASSLATTARWTITVGSDQGGCKIYKDGVAQTVASTGTAPASWLNPTNAPRSSNWIGRSNWNNSGFEGSIRYLRIYNRALSTSEVTNNVNNTVTFNANGGLGSTSPQTAATQSALTANAFSRSGYSFSSWNTAADGTGTTFTNSATYSFSNDLTLYAQWTLLAPVNTVVPAITGTPKVGETLTAQDGTWTSGVPPKLVLKWQRSADGSTWSDISGASGSTYTLTSADTVGGYVQVIQTATNSATNSGGSASVVSATSSIVLSASHQVSGTTDSSTLSDLVAAIPNDSTTYNVTLTTSNLATGKFKWSSQPANVQAILGEDRNPNVATLSYLPDADVHSSTWWSAGFPVLSFRGTGANIRTALNSLGYISSTAQTDVLRIQYATGSTTSTDVKNYIPIYDNGQLTFHYYAFQTQTARDWTNTQNYLRATDDIGSGLLSSNNWHLMTPRYKVEDDRGRDLATAAGLSTTAKNVLLGGIADANSSLWYYPAGTDGFSGTTTFSNGSTAQNGLYTRWIDVTAPTGDPRAMEYWYNNSSIYGWDDIGRTGTLIGAFMAETWSTTLLNTGTTATAAQTVRTVVAPDAPTNLTVTPKTTSSVTLNWTAPVNTGTDAALTDYTIQYSTDNATWSTWAHTPSTATSATLTGLTVDQLYWFRVAAVTSVTGAFTGSVSSALTETGSTLNVSGLSVPADMTGTIRVLIFSSNPAGKLYFTDTTGITGGIRNTANYPDTDPYSTTNGFNPATLSSAGRMVGLVDSSAADINSALASMQYTSATASTDTIKMWVSNGTEYIPIVNGANVEFHYYGFGSTATTWANARLTGAAGAARTIDGVSLAAGTAYLATLRYRAEAVYMISRSKTGDPQYWLNASDSTAAPSNSQEGIWLWLGPDADRVHFSTGSTAVNGEFEYWGTNEPNNFEGENCMVLASVSYSGRTIPRAGTAWGDVDCTSTNRMHIWEAFNTNAPYGSNTSNPAATNYTAPATVQTVVVSQPPAAPTALSATSTTNGQIDLSWTAPAGVSGITSYAVQYSTDGNTWTEARTSASTATTQSLTGLTGGTYYQIRVAAIVSDTTGYFASTYFTPMSSGQIDAVFATDKAITSLQLDSSLSTKKVRVLLRTTHLDSTIKVTSATGLDGLRGTSNYTTRTSAGRMIGLTGTGSDVNAALQTLLYKGPAASATDTISMWVSVGTSAAAPREFVPVVNAQGEVEFHYFGLSSSSQTWQEAQSAASTDASFINGQSVTGKFVATPNSLDQNALISSAVGTTSAWLGAGDYTTVNSSNPEGSWYFMGPDTGVTQFYEVTNNSGKNGVRNSQFVAWFAESLTVQNEPNFGVVQNCLITRSGSTHAVTGTGFVPIPDVGGVAWADQSCSVDLPYVWEFMSNEPVGSTTLGDNYSTMTAQSIAVVPPAEAPTSVTATASGRTSAVLSWTSPTVHDAAPLTGYKVEYATNSSFTGSTTISSTGARTDAILSNLAGNTQYFVRVWAQGSNWEGLKSDTVSVTTRSTASTLTIVESGGGQAGTDYLSANDILYPAGDSAALSVATVESALATGDLSLVADNVIVSAPVTWSSSKTLQLGSASSTVAVNADISASGATAGIAIAPAACAFSAAGT